MNKGGVNIDVGMLIYTKYVQAENQRKRNWKRDAYQKNLHVLLHYPTSQLARKSRSNFI